MCRLHFYAMSRDGESRGCMWVVTALHCNSREMGEWRMELLCCLGRGRKSSDEREMASSYYRYILHGKEKEEAGYISHLSRTPSLCLPIASAFLNFNIISVSSGGGDESAEIE